MKKFIIIGAVLISGMVSAQDVAKKIEVVGNRVKATYYYENGQVQQEGFYKDGKLDGTWVSYDENGTKNAIGEYIKGKKTGKWFFWNDTSLREVDYSESKIASIKNWKQDALVIRN